MKRSPHLSCFAILWLAGSLAWAQSELPGVDEPDPAARTQAGKRVKVGKTVYDFEEVDILGQLKRPEGQAILEPPELRFRRLLDLDEKFTPEIVRAVDEF